MTKYIDLLREHQQKQPSTHAQQTIESNLANAEHVSPATISNPYSHVEQKNKTSAVYDNLIEENTLTSSISANEMTSHDMLIEEEDDAENNLVGDAETPNAPNPTEAPAPAATPTHSPAVNPFRQLESFDVTTWLQHLSRHLTTVFSAAEQQTVTDLSELHESLQTLIDQIQESPSVVDVLELEISRNIAALFDNQNHNADLIQKAIMMMLYTIKTGLQLKIEHQELLHHMIAAMLHHVGMAMIPAEIRHKAGKLSKDEIHAIRQVAEHSVAFLQSCQIENENILRTVAQAHERYDGSGATGLKGHEISWGARLVGLLSMFESLIHFRAYRKRLLPRDAIRDLVNHHKKAFDPVMLKALIESISLYPVGTFVQINTGEIGLVVAIHNKFPLRPIVDINMDKHGNLINERRIDLKKQPNLLIQKCMYEEALEELRLATIAG